VQLSQFVIYGPQGQRRELSFKLGKLNVITGESQAGKSALIEAIKYCLGGEHFRVPQGVIRDSVSWYGLRVKFDGGSEAFLGRPKPDAGRSTTSAMMLLVGADVPVPDFVALQANTNADAVQDYLTAQTGIQENIDIPPETSTRPPLEANFSHALFYSLQRQDEIANRSLLFHRQQEQFIPAHIQATLPYLLGAVTRDYVLAQSELSRVKREWQLERRALDRARDRQERGRSEAFALAGEAEEVGLISDVPDDADGDHLVTLLSSALDSRSGLEELTLSSGRAFSEIENRRRELADEYRRVREESGLVKSLLSEGNAYEDEVGNHTIRLRSVELMPSDEVDNDLCPICGNSAPHNPSVAEIQESLRTLARNLDGVERDAPRLSRTLVALEEKATTLREEIADNQRALEAIADREREVADLRERINAQSYVRGRINHFLEEEERFRSLPLTVQEETLLGLERRMNELERILDPETVRENVRSILNVVGRDMGEWADRLKLEYSGSPVRIDISRLNVVADTPSGTIPLDQMGSAANWVGYHLVAHLALHKFFVTENRPVPHFLVLDQPTQAFYPPDVLARDDVNDLSDADRTAVTEMFKLMYDVCELLTPNFQVIVLDHANLNQPWFQESIVEEWRNGLKLVPQEWL
jgi:hypothetical protein